MELGPHGGGKPSRDPHGDSLTIFHGHKPCPGCPPPKAEDCTGEASAFPGVSWFGGGVSVLELSSSGLSYLSSG